MCVSCTISDAPLAVWPVTISLFCWRRKLY